MSAPAMLRLDRWIGRHWFLNFFPGTVQLAYARKLCRRRYDGDVPETIEIKGVCYDTRTGKEVERPVTGGL